MKAHSAKAISLCSEVSFRNAERWQVGRCTQSSSEHSREMQSEAWPETQELGNRRVGWDGIESESACHSLSGHRGDAKKGGGGAGRKPLEKLKRLNRGRDLQWSASKLPQDPWGMFPAFEIPDFRTGDPRRHPVQSSASRLKSWQPRQEGSSYWGVFAKNVREGSGEGGGREGGGIVMT